MLEATASTEPKVNKQYGKGNLKEKRSTEQGKQRLSNERGMKTYSFERMIRITKKHELMKLMKRRERERKLRKEAERMRNDNWQTAGSEAVGKESRLHDSRSLTICLFHVS